MSKTYKDMRKRKEMKDAVAFWNNASPGQKLPKRHFTDRLRKSASPVKFCKCPFCRGNMGKNVDVKLTALHFRRNTKQMLKNGDFDSIVEKISAGSID